jgi:hypothetical protein
MKKLLGKFTKGRSRPADEGASEAKPRGSRIILTLPLERIGLIKLADSTSGPDGDEQYPVDIVAVHGLNGDLYSTWTHQNGSLWLKDFLPDSLPGCRVFTYGYPSQVFSRSIADVEGYARRLLGEMRDIQSASGQLVCFSSFFQIPRTLPRKILCIDSQSRRLVP